MQAFKNIYSKVIPLDLDNVDTDLIIPAQFLTKINRDGYGEHLFHYLKEQDKDFVFNMPCYKDAQILLTKENFGCGSSREHAVWALLQAGIKVIIAQSYSDIFFNNAAKNGLLTITLPVEVIALLLEKTKQEDLFLAVDLQTQIIDTSSRQFHFDYDSYRKECFLNGQDDLDYLLEATR